MNLDDLRKQIDSLDSEIVKLLNERINVVLKIGEEKKQQNDKEKSRTLMNIARERRWFRNQ